MARDTLSKENQDGEDLELIDRKYPEGLFVCPGCDAPAESFVNHHWYEIPSMEMKEINICRSCNIRLTTNRFYPPEFYKEHKGMVNRILPSWDIQKEFLVNYLSRLKDRIGIE